MSVKKDYLWEAIKKEVGEIAEKEAPLYRYLSLAILNHRTLEHALANLLSKKLVGEIFQAHTLCSLMIEALDADAKIGESIRADIEAIYDRDPACETYHQPMLYFKGFHALQTYRIAHYFWNQGRHPLAKVLQSCAAEVFSIDLHPAAKIGHGILMDHGTGIVVGETAVIENDVSILHEVTLGGTGKESGDRHPKVRQGVLISAGAKILGNVEIGEGAKIGANAVVLTDVPPHTTFVGVPAQAAGKPSQDKPALAMDHASGIVKK